MQEPQLSKKSLVIKEVEASLTQLESLKRLLGKKKFNKRIKKAAKLLTARLPKTSNSKKNGADKTSKKLSAITTTQEPANTTAAVNE